MCLSPLCLGLPDERLLVVVLLLLGLQPLACAYRQLVVGAVEHTEAEGGPSEDLSSSLSASRRHLQSLATRQTIIRAVGRAGWRGILRTLTPTEVDMVRCRARVGE